MKKTYINPSLEVIRIQTQQMLAVSGDANPTFDPSQNYGGMDARGDDADWDD